MTTSRRKTIQDHVTLAHRFLEDSDREFAAGDELQGCEKLWGAACQSLMAVARQRRWRSGKSNNRADVVERLAAELQEPSLEGEFSAVEKAHANFYHDFHGGAGACPDPAHRQPVCPPRSRHCGEWPTNGIGQRITCPASPCHHRPA